MAVDAELFNRWLAPALPMVIAYSPTITPGSGYAVGDTTPISIQIQDANTALAPATVQLRLNQQLVAHAITNRVSGLASISTVSYQPTAPLPAGANTVEIIFGNNASPAVFQTNTFSFFVNNILAGTRRLTVSPPMLQQPVGPFTPPPVAV